MKFTHKTKTGFGGLLNKDIKCRIVQKTTDKNGLEKVVIETENGNFYHGKLIDLTSVK